MGNVGSVVRLLGTVVGSITGSAKNVHITLMKASRIGDWVLYKGQGRHGWSNGDIITYTMNGV